MNHEENHEVLVLTLDELSYIAGGMAAGGDAPIDYWRIKLNYID